MFSANGGRALTVHSRRVRLGLEHAVPEIAKGVSSSTTSMVYVARGVRANYIICFTKFSDDDEGRGPIYLPILDSGLHCSRICTEAYSGLSALAASNKGTHGVSPLKIKVEFLPSIASTIGTH